MACCSFTDKSFTFQNAWLAQSRTPSLWSPASKKQRINDH